MSVPAVSAELLERWKAIGGKVQEPGAAKKGAKKDATTAQVFIAPSGEKLSSWSDVVKVLEQQSDDMAVDEAPDAGAEEGKTAAVTGVKRGKENGKAAKEGAKKAKVEGEQPAGNNKRKAQGVKAAEAKAEGEAAGAPVVVPEPVAAKGKPAAKAKPAAKGKKAAAAAAPVEVAEAAPAEEAAAAPAAPGPAAAAKAKAQPKKKANTKCAAAAPAAPAAAADADKPAPAAAAAEPVADAAKAAAQEPAVKAEPAAKKRAPRSKEEAQAEVDPAAGKAKPRAKRAKAAKPAEPEAAEEEDEAAEEEAEQSDGLEEQASKAPVGSGRRAAQNKAYKEQGNGRTRRDDMVEVAEEPECDSEAAAVEQTAGAKGGARRRLVDFCLEDEAGQVLSIERILIAPGPVSASGAIYPEDGDMAKPKGRRVVKFGPVKDWKVVYSSSGTAVQIKTSTALYEVSRPAQRYRKVFAEVQEMLDLCRGVYCALCPDAGGSMTASLDEVVAKLARNKIGRSYGSSRDALLLNGKFVLQQLKVMTEQQAGGAAAAKGAKQKAVAFQDTAFGTALAAEVAKGPVVASVMTQGGALRILDADQQQQEAAAAAAAPMDAMMEADEEMARKLQAKMAAQEYGRARGPTPKGAAYIRISPEEIADDYPLPAQYEKEEEETDEMLLFDEEMMDCDAEYLPHRVLHNFSIYNAEGFFTTLELVPMWSGVDHDVEIFASGIVTEDEGDWETKEATAQEAGAAAAGGSGSGAGAAGPAAAADAAAPQQPQGMRLFLSQIREWVVECSCDSLAISIRTDVAWYRLAKPTDKYIPWFKTVLKAAKVAVHVLGLISSETRASRLSFPDVVKRLADQADDQPSFVSKKVDTVERFIVVHGQIILNQFKHFPNKAVQKAAFVSELRSRMEVRKHSKLYMGKVKAVKTVKARNSNPMAKRAAVGLRAKPMPATATRLVKAVWHGYFFGGKKQGEEEEAAAAPTAKEVEEDANEEEAEGETETALAEGASAAAGKKAAKGKQQKKKGAEEAGPSAAAPAAAAKKAPAKKKAPKPKVQLVGTDMGTDSAGRTLFKAAKVNSQDIALGQVVSLGAAADDEDEEEGAADAEASNRPLGMVVALFKDSDGDAMVQLRTMLRASETVLGDAGGDWELFASEDLEERPLEDVSGAVQAAYLSRPWAWDLRGKHFEEDAAFRKRNEEARAAGQDVQYMYRHLYCPEKGMFCSIPEHMQKPSGKYVEAAPEPVELGLLADSQGLIVQGVEYRVGDYVYLDPYTFTKEVPTKSSKRPAAKKSRKSKAKDEDGEEDEEEDEEEEEDLPGATRKERDAEEEKEEEEAMKAPAYARKSGKHKGSNAGLKAFVIAQLTAVSSTSGGKSASAKPSSIKVRRFYRPEDVSRELAYTSEWCEVYCGPDEELSVDVDKLVGKCSIKLQAKKAGEGSGSSTRLDVANKAFNDVFVCTGAYDPTKPGVVAPAPASLARGAPAAADKGKGKGKGKAAAKEAEQEEVQEEAEEAGSSAVALATMDIFAGCGGLSEGMHQAGVADTRWGVEYEPSAAEAFQKNNPDAKVFCNNCNVLLRAAMEKANLADDCEACDDCMDAAAKLSAEDRAALPLPGDVEFIMGGPPCQGYSGMNRFNKSNWSLVQNSMVMSFLSYCEFYRPRYFLLENVRNFVSHNKSFTFRLTLRTLLEMGYQVRFGVLNAGNYGVPQSRKRTIIWAAAPGEVLPDWPKPSHVFHSPQLTINLPGGVQYTAVPNQVGAPLRAVTVKDAIFDLPPINNGHQAEEMSYGGKAVSAYQRFIRGSATTLQDHMCKEMNELNLERCRCIPKGQPGADWRVLQEIVKEDPERELFKGQPLVPWCLPNTAARHNGWRGLFGRLDPNGHFPTSTTDPQPMGKVGQVFHPEQDRIVSVRECARSQGFPDTFLFAGNVHNRHRQVGNAVPPPLAAALGRRLRNVLEDKRSKDVAARLAAQMGF